jgi:hypothetical protein
MMTDTSIQITPVEENIFVSYSRADGAELASKLHDALEDVGLKVWLDVYNIAPGTNWNEQIDIALESVDVILVILTPGAVKSLQVMSEWNYALDKDKPVIPLLAQHCEVPRRLRVINYVDITSKDYRAVVPVLAQRVKQQSNSLIKDVTSSEFNPNSFEGFYIKRGVLAAIFIACLLTGVIYELTSGRIQSLIGVQQVLLATLILMIGIRNVYRYISENIIIFLSFITSTGNYSQVLKAAKEFYSSVYHTGKMTILSIIYGITVSGTVTLLNGLWQTEPTRAFSFAAFLFFVNFVTGLGFYSLAGLFRTILKVGRTVDFDFWERNNPATHFVLNIAGRLAIFTSLYTSLTLNSVYFLDIPLSPLLSSYSLFAGLVAIAAYVVPTLPLRKKFTKIKHEMLMQIDQQIMDKYKDMIEKRSDSSVMETVEIEKLNGIRRKVDKVEIWPYSIRSLAVIVVVTLFTVSPIVASIILRQH